ncbi:Crp/Fnr family transcriptional regulator [uncultured Microscilla sp.]|uniref:Crp/Fnr family transcriptional regulator n=1 Tax=uncultured Microscilla sp. TaxID=432653 RepID=UPI002625AFE7|nr:Crp/Fnr family transcriptional regulator [uncultured Microscilla sp.]
MIKESILQQYEAEVQVLNKGDILFMEGEMPRHYYQIKEGEIKVSNYNNEGKEFMQGIFYNKQSFGEPPLLGNFPYPATSQALKTTTVYKLPLRRFIELLQNNFEVHWQLTATLSQRLRYKAMIMKEISSHSPEHRILTLIDYLKKHTAPTDRFEVKLTRQQIADLTGLRVETVIRAIKNLEAQQEVQIIGRKVYR